MSCTLPVRLARAGQLYSRPGSQRPALPPSEALNEQTRVSRPPEATDGGEPEGPEDGMADEDVPLQQPRQQSQRTISRVQEATESEAQWVRRLPITFRSESVQLLSLSNTYQETP